MNCPKCNSSNKLKSGKIKERQRYRCKECGYNYNVELKSTAKQKSLKRQALHLYLEGLDFVQLEGF
jgi:transposase-like protein